MRPNLTLVSEEMVKDIVATALEVIESVGILFENPNAVALLGERGVVFEGGRGKIPQKLALECIEQAPSEVRLYDRNGELAATLGGDHVCFDPGSAALRILDPDGTARKPVTEDLVKLGRLVNELGNIGAQSTAMISSDVPEGMDDWYRLLIALLYSTKPVITGTFSVESFAVMKSFLVATRGSEEALKERPLAIFDACPSPPLKWSTLTSQSVIDCARAGIPSEYVSMPMTGATAPATLRGAVVQHAAETIAGVVLAQSASPGAPVIYGGSPSAFDMRHGTTPMGAIETMMIDCAYAQVGKHLGLPTHAYMGLSDAKLLDAQAGLETGIGAVLAALNGINMISGLGMLDFESCQSLEKLVIDNEIAGMTLRLLRGIERRDEDLLQVFADLIASESLLAHPHTLKWFRQELSFPSDVIYRSAAKDTHGALERAGNRVSAILQKTEPALPAQELVSALMKEATARAKEHGLERLPLELAS